MSMYQLQTILYNYKIKATVVNEIEAPSVKIYEIKLGDGIREATLKRFRNDIARDLKVENVEIRTIAERGTCGIEVPKNQEDRDMVDFNEIFDSPKFINSKSPLAFGVGKDCNGDIVIGDLKNMPHLLVAGTTGSGKTVFLNLFIASILYRMPPSKVKFLMIDPKVVELRKYKNLPHMLCPVINDPEQAIKALEWAAMEMDRRYLEYEKNSDCYGIDIGNIDEFNDCMKEKDHRPHIVIVIDEFSDLMMESSDKNRMEYYIKRLGQKARACGIHMVLATQRPDAQTITGLIKANLPSRIAFSVADAINSNMILGKGSGANNLIGQGDMIYRPDGKKPSRIQSGYISKSDINKLINFIISKNGTAQYDDYLMKMLKGSIRNNTSSIHPCWTPLLEDVARKSGWDENGDEDAVDFLYMMENFVDNFGEEEDTNG